MSHLFGKLTFDLRPFVIFGCFVFLSSKCQDFAPLAHVVRVADAHGGDRIEVPLNALTKRQRVNPDPIDRGYFEMEELEKAVATLEKGEPLEEEADSTHDGKVWKTNW